MPKMHRNGGGEEMTILRKLKCLLRMLLMPSLAGRWVRDEQ